MLLGSLTVILFQIIRSQDCIEQDDAEQQQFSISLSDEEVVYLYFNELDYSSTSFNICSNNKIDNVNVVVSMKLIQYVQHQNQWEYDVLFLKQYKTTKNRMPRQSQLIIGQLQIIQQAKFYQDKDPEIQIVFTLQDQIYNFVVMDTVLIVIQNWRKILIKVYPKMIDRTEIPIACALTSLVDQLNETIFSNGHNQINANNNWQKNMCPFLKLDYKCENQQFGRYQEVLILQTYQDQTLTFSSERTLFVIDLVSKNSECLSFQEIILAYDYDLKTKKFVIVHANQITYDGETYGLNLRVKKAQVFLTKSFILLGSGTEVTIFTKKLRLISTTDFKRNFQIIANQLQDQFIMADKNYIFKYLLYETPFFEINTKQQNDVNLIFEIQAADALKNIVILTQSDYDIHVKTLNISKTIDVSTIYQSRLLKFQKCQYDKILMGAQQFNQYNKLSILFTYQLRIFDLDSFKIIFAFSSSYIFLGQIDKGNLKVFKRYSVQDEVITKLNSAFQIQDNKINYIHCTYISCYFYLDVMNTYDQKKVKKIENGQVHKVVSDNNHFYLLLPQKVLIYNITEQETTQSDDLDATDVVNIFASPKKKDFLFVQTQNGSLCLYSISFPFQDLISSFSLNVTQILEFVIFEEYFLIFTTDSKEQTICNVYNYQNELNIFLQRKLPLFFFKMIDFNNLQVDYDKNILYIKGLLTTSNEHVIVAYRVDKRIEQSMQFITKLKSQIGFVLPISNSMTLRFENKFNFTSIYQNGDLRETCLIDKFLNEDDQEDYDDDDDSSSDSDSDADQDDTLSLDESYKFSSSSFISISSAGELLILGMQSVYGRRRPQNIDIFQPL
ncbi:unnamed protein product (macronuclear) [Paramecium tetraurelia]|uniref:Cleavage/polyadenylation specificity factor A subunit N-terminal domain-containing protein n=1 Tax=Paramecium tetraurelia TaxID=5888 RepID=A0C2I8_PARTE|nr:uncharacterized protein GSPATT00034483001 [Paramecium tetraurelia]CAK65005.1 unnamed protein product [Paramecium tetraurelia]|eukprot:XP_001432402.1 hypothetical protein (macronuclear) [Paramecium tetraurelia strain d4-2]